MQTQRAVVIGSGVAGLLMARVLAERFAEVVVLERDPESAMAGPRQGAAQGWHLHGLLAGGMQAMMRLFPGFERDLAAAGACMGVDAGVGVKLFYNGRWAPAALAGFDAVAVTRPTLERCLRARVVGLANVSLLYETAADGLLFAERRVTGVRLRGAGEHDRDRELTADLVVDASGRGSQAAALLKAQGFPAPEEEVIGLDFGYTCALYHVPEGFEAEWSALMVAAAPPASQGAVLMPVEGDCWVLGVAGRGEERPPADEAGVLDYLKRLPHPLLYECVVQARRAGELKTYRFPGSLRRHYERLDEHPEGFLAVGDALCSLNPIYGQGMSVAALEAEALLRLTRSGIEEGLWRAFYKEAFEIIAQPWDQTLAIDVLYAQTRAPRPPGFPLVRAISLWAQRLAIHDTALRRKVLKLTHLVDGPEDRLGLADLLAAQWRAWVSPSPESVPTYRIAPATQAA